MKYYYMDQDEIAIRTSIKNIKAISTSVIPSLNRTFISCTTSSGSVLNFDNKSRHFPLFLDTLSRVYNEEKDQHYIIILDDYTEKILNQKNACTYPYNFEGVPTFVNQKIDYQRYDLESILPIIYELLDATLSISGNKVEGFVKLTGIRDRFTLILKVNNQEKIIPILFTKNDDFSYKLTLGNIFGIHSIDTTIDFLSAGLLVKWYVNGTDISGILNYEVDDKVKKTLLAMEGTTYFFHNEEEKESLSEEKIPDCIKTLYPGYDIYHLENDLYIATFKEGLKKDIHFISDTNQLRKTRNYYEEEAKINRLTCPILSSKRVIEEYPITDDLTLTQEFFTYNPLESDYYVGALQDRVSFKIIADGKTYYPKEEKDITYIKTLDEKMLRKVIEEMKE